MPSPRLIWALFLFLMILTLGMGTAFGLLEMLVCTVLDFLPNLRKYRSLVVTAICIFGFVCGLSMCFSDGIQTLDLLDHAANISILYIGTLEMIAFGWCLGPETIFDAMMSMGIHVSNVMRFYLTACWITGPVTLFFTIVGTLILNPKFGKHHGNSEGYSARIQVIGGIIACLPLAVIVFGFFLSVYWDFKKSSNGYKLRSIVNLFKPTVEIKSN